MAWHSEWIQRTWAASWYGWTLIPADHWRLRKTKTEFSFLFSTEPLVAAKARVCWSCEVFIGFHCSSHLTSDLGIMYRIGGLEARQDPSSSTQTVLKRVYKVLRCYLLLVKISVSLGLPELPAGSPQSAIPNSASPRCWHQQGVEISSRRVNYLPIIFSHLRQSRVERSVGRLPAAPAPHTRRRTSESWSGPPGRRLLEHALGLIWIGPLSGLTLIQCRVQPLTHFCNV